MGYILTVALNAAIDTTLTLDEPLQPGESHRAREALKLPGGKGLNVARVLHTLGVPVHATGLVGGSTADFITQGLRKEGIEASFAPIGGTSRTCNAVVECDSGRVTEINEPGPSISAEEAQAFLGLYERLLPGSEAVALSGSLPPGLPADYYAGLIERARAAGVPAVLDTSGTALRAGIEAGPLLVKPNAAETRQFLGHEARGVEDLVAAGEQMRQQGAQMVALTRGAEGALLISGSGVWQGRVQLKKASVSSVGSGDAFIAGFLAGLRQAVDSGECASLTAAAGVRGIVVRSFVLAIACGAANTLHLGAGILEREDVEYLRRIVEVAALG